MNILKITSFITLFFLTTFCVSAQTFTTAKELKKYYKNNVHELPSPQEGWHNVWVILPAENAFQSDHTEEVIDAKVLVEEGEIVEVFYENSDYHQLVSNVGKIKKGKGEFQKVLLDINSNVTEVFIAYSHTVIFKHEEHKSIKALHEHDDNEVGNMSFYSYEKKVEKQGYYLFVKNEKTNDFDLVGYLNKKGAADALKFNLKPGDYEIYSIQNKIQVNRRMPTQKHQVTIDEESDHKFELAKQ